MEGHQWTYIYHPDEKKWYAVDVTWDNLSDGSDGLDLYFMVGSNTEGLRGKLFKDTHIPNSFSYYNQATIFKTPVLSPSKYEKFEVDVSYSITKNTNKNVVVMLKANREMQEIDGWKISEDRKMMQKEYEENVSENITLISSRNEVDEVKVEIENIDKISPEISVNYSTKDFTNQNVVVKLTSNEPLQEIEGWEISKDKLSMTKIYGSNRVETLQVKDEVGNIQIVDICVNNISKIGPDCLVIYSTLKPTNQDVKVVIKADKEVTEVEGWTISEDNMELSKTFSANIVEDVNVEDLYGNITSVNISVNNIDRDKPKLDVEYNIKDITNQDVLAIISADEEIKQPEGWSISSNGKVISKYYSENISEKLEVEDLAGNKENISVNIHNIDKEKPKIEVEYSTKEETDVVEVSIIANEEIRQIEGWEFLKSNNKLVKKFYSNTSEILEIFDLAGNKQDVEIEINNIKNTSINANISNVKDSTYDKPLPKAGYSKIIIFLIISILVFGSIIFYLKYKRYSRYK